MFKLFEKLASALPILLIFSGCSSISHANQNNFKSLFLLSQSIELGEVSYGESITVCDNFEIATDRFGPLIFLHNPSSAGTAKEQSVNLPIDPNIIRTLTLRPHSSKNIFSSANKSNYLLIKSEIQKFYDNFSYYQDSKKVAAHGELTQNSTTEFSINSIGTLFVKNFSKCS